MAEKNEYSYKLNEVYHAATVHTKRLMKTYAEEYAYRASEEEGESEKKKVLKFFAEIILSGVAKGLLDYFDKDEIYDSTDEKAVSPEHFRLLAPLPVIRNELKKLVEEDLLEVDLDDIKLTTKGLDLANLVWEEFV